MNTVHGHFRPFRGLLQDSFRFIKSHARDLLFLFLPIALGLLVLMVADDLYGTSMPVYVAVVLSVAFFVLKMFRSLMVLSGGLIVEDIKDTHHHIDPFVWYKRFASHIPSILLVMVMTASSLAAFAIASVIAGLIVLVLPFLVFSLLAKVSTVFFDLLSLQGNSITLGLTIIICIGIAVMNVWFALGLWSSLYEMLIEKKKGLDALATSFMHVRGRRLGLLWRLLLITLLAFLPFIIFVGPVYVWMLVAFLKQLAFSILLFGSLDVVPVMPLGLSLAETGLSFVASLITLPLYVVFSYFLWKDLRSSAHAFSEKEYVQTRKWLQIAVWAGAVVIAVCVCLMIITSPASQQADEGNPFGNIPASGMMQ